MIKIVKQKVSVKPKRKKKPYYQLEFDYMIGDADGETMEKIKVSVDNPFLERFVSLINKLKPKKGHWGMSLNYETVESSFKRKLITKNDKEFLLRMMFEDESSFIISDEDDDNGYVFELSEGVKAEVEYSFLTLQSLDLYYYDEDGKRNKTKIK